jgi:hypothetical protein
MKTFLERLRDNLTIAEREGDHWGAARIKQSIAVLQSLDNASEHVKRARRLFVPQQPPEAAPDDAARLRAAMHDLAGHVWRGDWDKLKPETRAALGEKE